MTLKSILYRNWPEYGQAIFFWLLQTYLIATCIVYSLNVPFSINKESASPFCPLCLLVLQSSHRILCLIYFKSLMISASFLSLSICSQASYKLLPRQSHLIAQVMPNFAIFHLYHSCYIFLQCQDTHLCFPGKSFDSLQLIFYLLDYSLLQTETTIIWLCLTYLAEHGNGTSARS